MIDPMPMIHDGQLNALSNTPCHIRKPGADLLRVQVRDDGRGGATLAGGTGLLGLKDRAEALGGRIFLDSPPDAGTTLRLELPLTDANDGDPIRPVSG